MLIPIYKICVTDTNPEPLKRFFTEPYGVQLLSCVAVPKESIRLEKSARTGIYRVALYLQCGEPETAYKIAKEFEEVYAKFKEAFCPHL